MEFPAGVEFVDEKGSGPAFVHESQEAGNTARCSTGL
jgi:hypothetical protein